MGGLSGLNKGKDGEREVATALNGVLWSLHKEMDLPIPTHLWVQRNTQQSAVGGCDLTGTFDLIIEVKRQEALSINTWWAQCTASAKTLEGLPVLIFRQNKQKWRVMVVAALQLPNIIGDIPWELARVELTWDQFLAYFKNYARRKLILQKETEANKQHSDLPLTQQ